MACDGVLMSLHGINMHAHQIAVQSTLQSNESNTYVSFQSLPPLPPKHSTRIDEQGLAIVGLSEFHTSSVTFRTNGCPSHKLLVSGVMRYWYITLTRSIYMSCDSPTVLYWSCDSPPKCAIFGHVMWKSVLYGEYRTGGTLDPPTQNAICINKYLLLVPDNR